MPGEATGPQTRKRRAAKRAETRKVEMASAVPPCAVPPCADAVKEHMEKLQKLLEARANLKRLMDLQAQRSLATPVAPPPVLPPPRTSKFFTDAYAVSLPEDFPHRFPRIKGFADHAGIPLKMWKGVKVTPADKPGLPLLGVGTTHFEDRTRTSFNLGVIGAFLAHRGLFQHLADSAPTKPGTLIFEDDVFIPSDFYKRLADIESEIPDDWDMIYLDKYREEGQMISPHVMKLTRDMTAKKNWGMWAFIVKNSALKDRILPTMEHMLDVPDIQLMKFAHKLNFYLVRPSLVQPDPATAPFSVVTELDKQK